MIEARNISKNHFTLFSDNSNIGYVIRHTQDSYNWLILLTLPDKEWLVDRCVSAGTVIAIIEGLLSKVKSGLKVDVFSVQQGISAIKGIK